MNIQEFIEFCKTNVSCYINSEDELILKCKKGSKIHIKKKNRGKFTDYCDGKVT